MAFPLLGVGLGISALGSLLGANSQANARRDQANRLAGLDKRAVGMMQQSSPWEQQLAAFMKQMQGQSGGVGPITGDFSIDPSQGPGAGAWNAGQDALMQFLRSDPTRQTGALDTNLQGLLSTGNPFDWQGEMGSALRSQDEYDTSRALAELNGSMGSLGQRFGTANQHSTGDLLAQLTNARGVRNAGLAQGSFENAQARRLQAGGILAGLEGQRTGDLLQGIGLAQQGGAQQNQVALANQDAALRIALANQQGGQFNAGLGMDRNAQIMQALGLGGQLQQSRLGMNQDLLRMMFGGQMQDPAGAGGMGNAMGEVGSTLALLPFMQQLMNRPVSRTTADPFANFGGL